MTLADWLRDIATADPLGPDVNGPAGTAFLEQWILTSGAAADAVASLGPSAPRFLFVAQYSLAEAVWDEGVPIDVRVRAVEASPAILAATNAQFPESLSVFGFWDVLLRPWSALRLSKDHMLLSIIAQVLLQQLLTAADEHTELTALHGINHLKDPATAERARAHLPQLGADAAAYAERALKFQAP